MHLEDIMNTIEQNKFKIEQNPDETTHLDENIEIDFSERIQKHRKALFMSLNQFQMGDIVLKS